MTVCGHCGRSLEADELWGHCNQCGQILCGNGTAEGNTCQWILDNEPGAPCPVGGST